MLNHTSVKHSHKYLLKPTKTNQWGKIVINKYMSIHSERAIIKLMANLYNAFRRDCVQIRLHFHLV